MMHEHFFAVSSRCVARPDSDMLPLSSTHEGCTQMEYAFVYVSGLHSTSFSMHCAT